MKTAEEKGFTLYKNRYNGPLKIYENQDLLININDSGSRNGILMEFSFDNGYTASLVCHAFSYGACAGLYELAVLDKEDELVYDTPVTGDVEGQLTLKEAMALVCEVSKLPKR